MGGGATNPNSETFSISGPFHLTSIDWTDSYHRTAVASSLVQGVHTLERDRQKERVGPESLAKPWWEFFHFTLLEPLIDSKDCSIYGAIFEYELYNLYQNTPDLGSPPRYVIAFRGTNLSRITRICDVKLDLLCGLNSLHRGTRSKHVAQAVENVVVKHPEPPTIWLVGHSLGAALALVAGKSMIKSEFLLEAYIFNPPISSFPLEQLLNSKILKDVLRITGSVIKAMVFKGLQVRKDFTKTASWIPHLYVNAADPICSEYIGYFQHKALMSQIGASGDGISLRSILFGRRGKSSSSDLSTDPFHVLQSANMTVNKTEFKTAHELCQWWEPDSALRANWETHCIRPYSGKLLKSD